MREVLEASFFYRVLAAVYAWFGRQWRQSRLISAFLRPGCGAAMGESSMFARLWQALHRAVCAVFSALRLDRALEGSVFRRVWFWCMLPVAAAPILPTMAVAALAAAGLFSVFVCWGSDRTMRRPAAPVNKYILLFAALYLIATFTSVTVRGSLQGGILTVFFILFGLALQSAVTTRRQLDRTAFVLVLVGTVTAAYGVAQYLLGLAGAANWLDSAKFTDIDMRVYSTLDNPNVLAEYLVLIFPLAFAFLLTKKGARSRVLALIACGVMALCLVLTYSRGGWLGFLVAMALFLVILDRRFIVLGLAALVALYFILPDAVVSRFTSIGDMSDSSTTYRVAIWMGTIAMLRDYWICGIGPGTAAFNMVYPSYSYSAATAQHSHNLYLQIVSDCGVGGIAVFLMLLVSFVRMLGGAAARERDRTSRVFQTALLSGMLGFLVQSATDYSFYNYRMILLFWVYISLGVLFARRSEMEEG